MAGITQCVRCLLFPHFRMPSLFVVKPHTLERELLGLQAKIKKYFYMLRPLLAAWIEQYQAVPPMELAYLLLILEESPDIKSCIDELLERKQHIRSLSVLFFYLL
ncbi:hypothetical protein CRENPOLYSF2_590002 [Crenothrix polyspora]|uniref:Uncharacterized protein n=2 Tax=Crenothrix polyspora TaxID=360316 RepID=A0A1R4HHK7_9GAMM|nr:hypothetical protein CRENPOLYSF2_590002 [Crenothrix polyspora]